MIDKSKQYKTRDGREVRIYATDGYNGTVHGAVFYDSIQHGQGWRLHEWDHLGRYNGNISRHDLDLIEVKPRIQREVWVNVYPAGQTFYGDRSNADALAVKDERIACVRLTIDCEEGTGL